ncbi:hypothetical protein SKAU_G00128680 [Synaphobranchus kaupii]|uniref:Uncharacterized protein n=1 Tax=Synaphobranchus kaupii TaxID=118154 RepID=A0A9Q1J0Z7_SYNKA|nr:hypothetical protein SKAU_G00128680 [Synaphobranchus kaupii]
MVPKLTAFRGDLSANKDRCRVEGGGRIMVTGGADEAPRALLGEQQVLLPAAPRPIPVSAGSGAVSVTSEARAFGQWPTLNKDMLPPQPFPQPPAPRGNSSITKLCLFNQRLHLEVVLEVASQEPSITEAHALLSQPNKAGYSGPLS